ncbi:SCO family protein [Alphaproteobacteria bacterium]|nr:SCO family protein [Alphaproteobacteria bacterium]
MTNKLKVILFSATLSLIIILLLYIKTQDKEEGFFLSREINNYDLYTDNGDLLKRENILEYPSVFFFGFLDCPDICPNTLAEISNIIFELGERKNNINFFFVTVDPERDTISEMRNYLDNFHDNIIGITGSPNNVKKFLKSMHVYYKKVFIEKDLYTMDHSSQLYLFEKNGKFFGTTSLSEEKIVVFDKIEAIIKNGA